MKDEIELAVGSITPLAYLQGKEWSMGCGGKENRGQCPECYGSGVNAHGHPCYLTADTIGHEVGCELAVSIRNLGGNVIFKGEYESDVVWESFVTEGGLYSTRVKNMSEEKA